MNIEYFSEESTLSNQQVQRQIRRRAPEVRRRHQDLRRRFKEDEEGNFENPVTEGVCQVNMFLEEQKGKRFNARDLRWRGRHWLYFYDR